MQSSYPTALAAVFALVAASCSSLIILPANVQIVPTQYQLSPADIRAIQALPRAAGIDKPLHAITASSPDVVQLDCGDPYHRDAQMTAFTARRKNGGWIVDRTTINHYRPIIVN